MKKTLETAFKSNEAEKKTAYNKRVTQIEHGSFTPIVFSALGGCGRETSQFVKSLIEKLSKKRDIPVSITANYIRTKISFELLRSQVMCIRGSRSNKRMQLDTHEMEVTQNTSEIKS